MFFPMLATGAILAGIAATSTGATPPVPETFVADAPVGRHDTVAQVTMDDGAKLWVKVLGDDPGKPLLIAHHGAPGVSSHLEPEASFGFLADHFRVLVFDARGSGVSDLKEPYSHERWVEDVDQLRRWAGADKFVLAGGSYGTFISLEYALRHPEHLDAVVLRGPSAEGPSTIRHGLEAALKGAVPKDDERQTRMWMGQARDDDDLKIGFEEFARVFAPPPGQAAPASEKASAPPTRHFPPIFHAETHDWAFSRNLPAYDVREQLASIHVPMLVTVGRYDQVTVPAGAELIAQKIPGAKLVIFEHSGHSVPADEPAKFQATVNNFLDLIYQHD
ncbi:MAG: alpha/beta fold hydrolase [Rhodospirillales bacterium]|nr:alpha/beta fold hydrolase [Acetobacter sp.]